MNSEYFIKRTLSLARKGIGRTKTNPMVGAILTQTIDGVEKIIGSGYHHGYGLPHAEVEAVKKAKRLGYHDLSSSKLYINLEPCCHHGKTPPCTELILMEKIPRVVFGTLDPNPKVSGKGAAVLERHGVKVEYGFAEKECRELNKAFFKIMETGFPWITLKTAQTLDGKIALPDGQSKWISNESSRRRVHRLRSESDAVLVGAGTVIQDNPSLTVRMVKGRQPFRIIVDGGLRSPLHSVVFNDEWKHHTIVLTSAGASVKKILQLGKQSVTVLQFSGSPKNIPLKKALKILIHEYQIASILVEGGSQIFGQFLIHNLADEIMIFIAPKFFGNGIHSVTIPTSLNLSKVQITDLRSEPIDDNILIQGNILHKLK